MTWRDELDARGCAFHPEALPASALAAARSQWADVCAARAEDDALLGD
jgi:hypothetical protein